MDESLWNSEQKKITILVCIDLSATFDTVDHSVLLKVLNNYYEISGSALQWYELYLVDKSMKVSTGDVYSETMRLSFSVPQGNCGGPVLYCVYASLILEIIPNQFIIMHLQMIRQFRIASNPSIANSELNFVMKLSGCLDNGGSWMDSNRLKMNAKRLR